MDPRPRPARIEADLMLAAVQRSLFDAPPPTVGRFEIEERLGAGGMGLVYRAYDPQLDRSVALKVLRLDERSAGNDNRDELLREARAAAKVVHPNVIGIHEVGVAGGEGFVAMELVPGATLRGWSAAGERSAADVLDVLVAAGRGLAAAHEAGLVHRDFKPDNVLIGDDGRVKVTDFGLAQRHTEVIDHDDCITVDSNVTQTVNTRSWAGTPAYMAPELHTGAAATARSDQFAFCVTAYEALFGRRPSEGPRSAGEPPRRLPRRVVGVLQRGLDADPARRWPSMDALLEAIVAARRRPRVVAGLVLVATAAAGAAASTVLSPPPPLHDEPPQCANAGDLDGVWDDDRRAALEEASQTHVVRRARRTLDAYAEAWRQAAVRQCEATVQTGSRPALAVQAERCLDQRRGALEAVARIVAHEAADPERVIGLLGALPAVADCEDEGVLRAMPDPPADPELARRVAEVRPELARAQALNAAGSNDKAQDAATVLLATARALGHDPLLADVLAVLGEAQSQLGRPEAHETLEEGVLVAERAGYDLRKANLLTALAVNAGGVRRAPRIALDYARRAQASIERLGGQPRLEVRLRSAEAVAYWALQDHDAVIDAADAAIRRWEQADMIDSRILVAPLSIAASAWTQRGEHAKAEALNRQALAIVTADYGEDHRIALGLRNNLALILRASGRHDEAAAELEALLDVHRLRGEVGRIDAVRVERNLCHNHFEAGRLPQAVECAEDNLSLARSIDSAQDVESTQRTLVELYAAVGRREDAVRQACMLWASLSEEDSQHRTELAETAQRSLGIDPEALEQRCRTHVAEVTQRPGQ